MSRAIDYKVKNKFVFNPLEPRFGAKGDNTTDDTAALQSAINAAVDSGGSLFLPGGPGGRFYRNTGLTIDGPLTFRGEGKRLSWLRMIGGSDTNCITVAVGVDEGLVLSNFGIDGVRSANSSGHGVHFPIDGVNSYGHSATMQNLYITQCAGDGVRQDGNRNNARGYDVTITRCTNGLRVENSSDSRWDSSGIGINDERALYVVSGADNCFDKTSFFMSIGTAAVTLAGTSSSPTKIRGCTINGNEKDGLEMIGPSGIARHIAHIIEGNWFETNGLETNDAYSDIVCTDISGIIIKGNSFRYPGSGNKPKYLIEFTGATAAMEWEGNSYTTSPAPYATALTNQDFRLYSNLRGLNVIGQITGDPSYYVNAVDDAAAAAASVPVGRFYRTGSTLKIRVS